MKESNINRIFATPEEKTEDIKESLKNSFESQNLIVFKTERSKTPEELAVLDFVDQETNLIVKEFGGEELIVPKNVIHLISEEEQKELMKNQGCEYVPAAFVSNFQGISMEDKDLDLIKFTNMLSHEMLHLKSFQSVRLNLDKQTGDQRRVGLRIPSREDRHKSFFVDLNEAMTEYFKMRMVWGRWAENRHILPEELKKETENLNKKDFMDKFETSYRRKQLSLMEIMDNIIEKNPGEFKNRDDVLKVFGEAYFTGHLLKLRKLIDGAYGHGSFVEFAESGLPKSKWEIESDEKKKEEETDKS